MYCAGVALVVSLWNSPINNYRADLRAAAVYCTALHAIRLVSFSIAAAGHRASGPQGGWRLGLSDERCVVPIMKLN